MRYRYIQAASDKSRKKCPGGILHDIPRVCDLHHYAHDCDRRSVHMSYIIMMGNSCPLLCYDYGVHVTTKIVLDELEEELRYVSILALVLRKK